MEPWSTSWRAGTLAAGVGLMKATGASEEDVARIARDLYRPLTFRLVSRGSA